MPVIFTWTGQQPSVLSRQTESTPSLHAFHDTWILSKCGAVLSEGIPHIYPQLILWADIWILSTRGGILSEGIPHIYSQKTLWADIGILSTCGGILSEGIPHIYPQFIWWNCESACYRSIPKGGLFFLLNMYI